MTRPTRFRGVGNYPSDAAVRRPSFIQVGILVFNLTLFFHLELVSNSENGKLLMAIKLQIAHSASKRDGCEVNIDSHYTGLPVDAICIRFIFMNSLRGESPIAEADRTRLRHECVTGKVTEIGGLNQPTTPRELPDSNLFVIARV